MSNTTYAHTNTTARRLRLALMAWIAALLLLLATAPSASAGYLYGWAPIQQKKVAIKNVKWYGYVTATWYGPGFYGRRTACGSILRTTTWGIAHRTLPCGQMVMIGLNGRRVIVPVIDRGPYSGATIDLTERTKRYVGFQQGKVNFAVYQTWRMAIKNL